MSYVPDRHCLRTLRSIKLSSRGKKNSVGPEINHFYFQRKLEINHNIIEPKTEKCPPAHLIPPMLSHMNHNSLKNSTKYFLLHLLNDSDDGLSIIAFTFTVWKPSISRFNPCLLFLCCSHITKTRLIQRGYGLPIFSISCTLPAPKEPELFTMRVLLLQCFLYHTRTYAYKFTLRMAPPKT